MPVELPGISAKGGWGMKKVARWRDEDHESKKTLALLKSTCATQHIHKVRYRWKEKREKEEQVGGAGFSHHNQAEAKM